MITVIILYSIQPLSWSLLSNRTNPVAQYRVYCSAAYVIPEHIVWRKNGTVVKNSTSTTISHQLVDAATDNYTNTLTVTGDHHTQTISCGVHHVSLSFNEITHFMVSMLNTLFNAILRWQLKTIQLAATQSFVLTCVDVVFSLIHQILSTLYSYLYLTHYIYPEPAI